MSDAYLERLVRLEVQQENLETRLDAIHKKVSDIHEVITKARGVPWTLGVLMTAGGAIAGTLAWFGFKLH